MPAHSIGFDPRDSGTLYAVADYPNRIFRTTDGGATWTDISPRYMGTLLSTVAATGGPTSIYVGTHGAGVFELTTGGDHF